MVGRLLDHWCSVFFNHGKCNRLVNSGLHGILITINIFLSRYFFGLKFMGPVPHNPKAVVTKVFKFSVVFLGLSLQRPRRFVFTVGVPKGNKIIVRYEPLNQIPSNPVNMWFGRRFAFFGFEFFPTFLKGNIKPFGQTVDVTKDSFFSQVDCVTDGDWFFGQPIGGLSHRNWAKYVLPVPSRDQNE